jgi:hypothetical protein
MKIRNVLIGSLLLVVVAGGMYFAYRRTVLPREHQQCEICGRGIHAGHEATLLMQDGKKIHACCPRCALHRVEHGFPKPVQMAVTDRISGREMRAQDAFYVEGSDELVCIPPSAAVPPRQPPVEYERAFDRCSPSLIAFKDEAAARDFAQVHGGRILSYGQAIESVRTQ